MTTSTNIEAASVRRATRDDLPGIERLLISAGLTTAGVADIVAEVNAVPKQIVAAAGLEVRGTTAVLRSVAVDPEWRGRGMGHELVRQIVCDAESRGIHALYLLTMTAEHYFPRLGFERIDRSSVPNEIAETAEFTSACPATAVAMKRALP